MFYLDLDEIDRLDKRLVFFSRNRFNLYNFRDQDHLQLAEGQKNKSIKATIHNYLQACGVAESTIGTIKLLTNLVTAGYIFNPVSFYFVFDKENIPLCAVVEVQNTFGELKPYFINAKEWDGKCFDYKTTKYFYVSPFMQHDSAFHFQLQIPAHDLHIKIDNLVGEETVLKTGLQGKKSLLTDFALLFYFVSIPLVTLKIIASIHWQAMLLFTKNIVYLKKNEHLDLQRELYNPHISLKNSGKYRPTAPVAEPQI